MLLRPVAKSLAFILVASSSLEARVVRIVIDTKVSPAFSGNKYGSVGQYETIAGRAWGELDPNDPLNAVIQDIALAPRNANGNVDYMATFFIVKPIDMSKASGLLWHDVPNRGGRVTIVTAERSFGDVGLSSGWQGDNSGTTAQVFPNSNDYAIVPVAVNPDGSPITGTVLGRIVNQSGPDSQPILVQGNPIPYLPFTLDTSQALLTTHAHETIDGQIIGEQTIASTDWAWAHCDATHPFPGVPTPGEICLRNGFDPTLLYQAVYTAQNPFILGIGFAAFRDLRDILQERTAGRLRHAQPAGRRHQLEHRSRRVPIGQLRSPIHPFGLQPGRSRAPGLRRRLAHHRRTPTRAQFPLGATRRGPRTLPTGQRGTTVVGGLSGCHSRSSFARHPGPLPIERYVSEDCRAHGFDRILGAQAGFRMGWDRCFGRPAAA